MSQQLFEVVPPALSGLRVGVYASAGAPYHHLALAALWGCDVRPLFAHEIRGGELAAVDVLVVPGGGLRSMSGQLAPLGEEGTRAIRAFVEHGGMYIGSCAGSFLPARVPESFVQANPQVRHLQMLDAPLANAADGGLDGLHSPGVGVVQIQVTAPDHWLTRGLPQQFEIVHYNGPVFRTEGASVDGVARFVTATSGFTTWEASLPGPSGERTFDTCTSPGAHNIATSSFGAGQVVLFGSHPEFGFDAIQLGWGECVRFFANALTHQAQRRDLARREPPELQSSTPHTQLLEVSAALNAASQRFERLREVDLKAYLGPQTAPGFLGLDAPELWREATARAQETTRVAARYTHDLAFSNLPLPSQWLNHTPHADQDYGFVGLKQLVEVLHQLLDAGEQALQSPAPAVEGPYDAWDRHPYHLIASSYLSAAGLSASAALAAGTLGTLARFDAPLPFPITLERSTYATRT